jgi:hypothetical protein
MLWPCHKYHAAPRGSATRKATLVKAVILASPAY